MFYHFPGTTLLIVVLFLGLPSLVSGQGNERARISNYLDVLADSRNAIKAFSVRMTGTTFTYAGKSTTPGKSASAASMTQVEIVSDMNLDASLIIVQTQPLFPGSLFTPPSPETTSNVYLVNGKQASQLNSQGKFIDVGPPERIPVPHPLSLGMGFCVESTRFFPFSELISRLETWEKSRLALKTDGALTSFVGGWLDVPKTYSSSISFDASRGGMVREISMAPDSRNKDFLRGEVLPIKIGEHWLPHKVAYQCGDQSSFFTWQMDWVSVNEPIPADLFDATKVTELLGL